MHEKNTGNLKTIETNKKTNVTRIEAGVKNAWGSKVKLLRKTGQCFKLNLITFLAVRSFSYKIQ
jgi:hypothetical protein